MEKVLLSYRTEFEKSLSDPISFWREQARRVAWSTAPETILAKDANGNDAWFPDGELNSSYLALDHHVEAGRGAL